MTLRERREREGLTQIDVANALDVNQGTVSNWERGKCKPVRKYRIKLAELFGAQENDLFPMSQPTLKGGIREEG